MTLDSLDTGDSRRLARQLAQELRSIIEDLSSLEISAEDLHSAVELAQQLHQRLRGPRRPRWYETGTDLAAGGRSRESRVAYTDQSTIRGVLNPIAPPLRVEVVSREGEPDCVEGRVRLGRAYEGLADAAHGGWVAALFDDVLGAAQGMLESPGVTAVLRTRFREVTPLDEELRLRAWIHEQRGRRIIIRGTCHAGDSLTADAEGIFMQVDFDQLRERMAQLRQARHDAK